MTYIFVYEPDYARVIPAIIIDCRSFIPEIKNAVGYVIKDYCDYQLSLIDERCIVYKIETDISVCAGFFVIKVNVVGKTASFLLKSIRPAFINDTVNLSNEIATFIMSSRWMVDYLF